MSRLMQRMRVLFPVPEGPMMPRVGLPAITSKLMPLSTGFPRV